MAYQGTPNDPLVNTTQCTLDATSMKTIGVNSIRVYHVDPYVSHDSCMSIFDAAGIYIWLDLDTFNTTLTETSPTWTSEQFAAFSLVMDTFHGYNNLAGWYIGNEIITSAADSTAATYVKAAVSDMKAYSVSKGYRNIPVGYSAADIAELRPYLMEYLACGDAASAVDFFSFNSYSWCGAATYDTSGYVTLQAQAANFSLPIFFSETGCNADRPRLFTDQAAIFGSDMVDTFSGSIIYEWCEEANNYGLNTYPDGGIYTGAPTPIQPDFQNLASQWATISPTGVASADYTPSLSAPACPASTAGGWLIDGDVPLPTLTQGVAASAASSTLSQFPLS